MIATDLSSLASLERGELELDSGLTYDGITPVRLLVTKREDRYSVSDGGGAVALAGVNPRRLAFAERIVTMPYSVNVSRKGVVWLPLREGQQPDWFKKAFELVADGSVALYEALLEVDE